MYTHFTEHEKSPSFHLKISFFDLQIHGSTKYPYPADNLAQSGVRIMTNVNQPQDTGYTPTQSVNIAYCGMRNSAQNNGQDAAHQVRQNVPDEVQNIGKGAARKGGLFIFNPFWFFPKVLTPWCLVRD